MLAEVLPLFESAAGLGALQTVLVFNEVFWADGEPVIPDDDDDSEAPYCEHCHGAALEMTVLDLGIDDLPNIGGRGAQVVEGWRCAAVLADGHRTSSGQLATRADAASAAVAVATREWCTLIAGDACPDDADDTWHELAHADAAARLAAVFGHDDPDSRAAASDLLHAVTAATSLVRSRDATARFEPHHRGRPRALKH